MAPDGACLISPTPPCSALLRERLSLGRRSGGGKGGSGAAAGASPLGDITAAAGNAANSPPAAVEVQCGMPAQQPEQQQAGQPAQLGTGAAAAPGSPSWDELEDGDDDDAPSWDLLDELAAAPSPPELVAWAGGAREEPAAAAGAAAAWEAPSCGQPAAPVPAAAAETAPELGWGADYESCPAEADACAGDADWDSPPERQQAAAVPAPHQQQQAQQQVTTGRRQSALSTGRRRRLRSIFADEDEDGGLGGLGAQVGLGRPGSLLSHLPTAPSRLGGPAAPVWAALY